MDNSDLLFWNVDTQNDFVLPKGKLYVKDAELLKPTWKKITQLAEKNNIQVVNTADFHYPNSGELSTEPDFVSTFPEHCMANTQGAGYIPETMPDSPVVFDWDREYLTLDEVKTARNIVIRKDAFDVFAGNPHTDAILKLIAPKSVIVYGVTTNVCVNYAVLGLARRVENVFVIEDAMKELPNIPMPFENWISLGVKIISYSKLKTLLETEI